jgi:hypothetical protein
LKTFITEKPVTFLIRNFILLLTKKLLSYKIILEIFKRYFSKSAKNVDAFYRVLFKPAEIIKLESANARVLCFLWHIISQVQNFLSDNFLLMNENIHK